METQVEVENRVTPKNIVDVTNSAGYVVCNEVIGVPYASPADDEPHVVTQVISRERWELPA